MNQSEKQSTGAGSHDAYLHVKHVLYVTFKAILDQ
jgi:hypothetical protein